MKNKEILNPRLLSPLDFWSIYFKHSVSVTPRHQVPKSSRALLALDDVFGNLITNCLAKIGKNRISIEYHGCQYINDSCPSACDSHMGGILGVLEITHNERFDISKDTKETVCRINLERIDD